MPHALFLCFEITQVVRIGSDFDGDVLHDFQAIALESNAFHGIVGHQAHFSHTEMSQHLCAAAIIAFIGFEAQMDVGLINR